MRRSFTVVLLAATLTGCGIGGTDRIGVSRGGSSGILIHYVPCPGEVVTRLAILGNTGGISYSGGNDQPGGDPDDDEYIIWQAASSGSTDTVFDTGRAPPGFVEEIPLTVPLAEEGELAVFVGSRSDGLQGVQIGIDLDDLRPGRIVSNLSSDPLGRASFERMARETCEG
ncbi:MAG TPA: hypothetical protein VEA19_06210 [Actinomycetota bacterium]|nr:hypothetical protein [Actinomycetota bacterium]